MFIQASGHVAAASASDCDVVKSRSAIRSAWSGLTLERGENPSCELSRATTIHQPQDGVQVVRVVSCQRVGKLRAEAGGL